MKKTLAFSLVALAACRGREPKNADSALTADLALAAQVQASRPVPQFLDSAAKTEAAPSSESQRGGSRIGNAPRVRVTPRQTVTQPVTTTAEPQPTGGGQAAIAAGTSLALSSQQRICTTANRPGDRFVATVTSTITGSNGATIPAGSNVVLEVVGVSEPSSASNGTITFAVHSVELNGRNYPVSGDVSSGGELERVRIASNANADRNKVIGGAAIGAVFGHIMGKSTKGTVIGAAAGAATGAVAAKMSEKYEGCLPVGAPMRLTLSSALLL